MTMIRARSYQQVMDWSLVLASQDIAATIVRSDDDQWALYVEPHEHHRALDSIRQYQRENRKWSWRQPIPWSEATFNWARTNSFPTTFLFC